MQRYHYPVIGGVLFTLLFFLQPLETVAFDVKVFGGVQEIALQPDGKILMVGSFGTVNSVRGFGVARLNQNGSSDPSFDIGSGGTFVVADLALQPDGKILVTGRFPEFNGVARSKIARLNPDGSVDTSFTAGEVNNETLDVALQPDGKVLIAGSFTSIGGVTRNHIARLNADGSLDTSFATGSGTDDYVRALSIQPDDKILIGGDFSVVRGNDIRGIARLNIDSSVDNSFPAQNNGVRGVRALALQPDGKIVIGGQQSLSSSAVAVVRLNANGSLDTSFDPGRGPRGNSNVALGLIFSVGLQADGNLLIGGIFDHVDNVPRNNIARLNPDGSLDSNFATDIGLDPVRGGSVSSLIEQSDGKILVGGRFQTVNGITQNSLARLDTNGNLDTGALCFPIKAANGNLVVICL